MTDVAPSAPAETGGESLSVAETLNEAAAGPAAAAEVAPAEGAAPAGEAAAPTEGGEPAPAAPAEPDYKARLHGATQALAQTRQQLMQAKRQLAEAQGKTPARPAIDIPDPSDDPMATLAAIRDLALSMQSEQATEAEREATETAQTQYISELKGAYEESEQLFEAIQPDYRDAASHSVTNRTAELQVLGLTADAAKSAIYNELLRLTDASVQAGKSPAEVLYGLAKARGYAPKAAAAPAPAPGAALASVEAGQAAAKTLSTAGGRTPSADQSPEARIANLSGAALVSAWNAIKNGQYAAA